MKLRRRCGLVRERISAMQSFHASELLPPGFFAVEVLSDVDSAVITIRARSINGACPSCGVVSGRVHSRYPRRLADLPIAGRFAVLILQARRFRCEGALCEHLHGTLRRQRPQALGAAHGPTRSDCPLLGDRPWRSTGGEFRTPLEHPSQQRHPVARRAQAGQPELRAPRDHWDRRLGLASQPSLWNADL